MSVELLMAARKGAWVDFKKVRSYIRPLYYSEHSMAIGEGNPKVLNSSGQKALARFNAADLKWKRALHGKNKET